MGLEQDLLRTTVWSVPVMTMVNRALSMFRPTAKDSMLAPVITTRLLHNGAKHDACRSRYMLHHCAKEDAGRSRCMSAGVTSSCKDTTDSVDHSRLIGHKDRQDMF